MLRERQDGHPVVLAEAVAFLEGFLGLSVHLDVDLDLETETRSVGELGLSSIRKSYSCVGSQTWLGGRRRASASDVVSKGSRWEGNCSK